MPTPNAAAWYQAMLLAYTTATSVLLLRRAAATRTTTGLLGAGLMAVATAVHVPLLLHEPPRGHGDDFWRWTVFPAMNALLGAIWLMLVLYYHGATAPPAPFVLLVAAFWGLKVWYFVRRRGGSPPPGALVPAGHLLRPRVGGAEAKRVGRHL